MCILKYGISLPLDRVILLINLSLLYCGNLQGHIQGAIPDYTRYEKSNCYYSKNYSSDTTYLIRKVQNGDDNRQQNPYRPINGSHILFHVTYPLQ